MRRSPFPLRIGALAVVSGLSVILSTAALASVPEPPPTTVASISYVDGVAAAPDGSFTAAFATSPTYFPAADGQPERLHADADEDAQEVARFGLDAFGAAADAGPTQRAELFINASGSSVEWLANTSTRLGADPAAHFIARLTLGDGRAAVVYGLVVVGAGGAGGVVTYAFATDVGADDADRARAFVSSFTLLLPSPVPVTTTTTTTVPPTTQPATTAAPGATTAPALSTVDVATSVPAPGASSSVAATTTVASGPPVPLGAVAAPDRSWWVTFPADAEVVATASTEHGFAYTDYRAEAGADVLAVRALAVPAGFDWDESTVPGFPTATVTGESITVDGYPAVASTFDDGDATVTAVVVDTGTHLVAATYADVDGNNDRAASDFVGSLGVPA